MTRLRRRPRAAYRVYDEDEYLAGADPLPVWEEAQVESSAGEPSHGRKLRRLAGAAALTGAVGTVGSVVGLAGLRAHAVDHRKIAERIAPSVRAAALRGHVSAPAHAARRQILHSSLPRRIRRHRTTPARISREPVSEAETSTRMIAVNAPSASATQSAPSGAPAGTRAQSEFGFER